MRFAAAGCRRGAVPPSPTGSARAWPDPTAAGGRGRAVAGPGGCVGGWFTRNPVTHTDDLVITAVRGLGEAMGRGRHDARDDRAPTAPPARSLITPLASPRAAWSPARTAGIVDLPDGGRTARRSMATSSAPAREPRPRPRVRGSVPPSTSRPRSPAASGSSSRLSADHHQWRVAICHLPYPPPRRGRPGISRRVRACGLPGSQPGGSTTRTGRSR